MFENRGGETELNGPAEEGGVAGQSESQSEFQPRHMIGWATAVALAAGTAVLIYLLRKYQWSQIVAAMAAAGWGIVWISIYRVVTIATDAAGWQALWIGKAKPSRPKLFVYRWIGEAVNSLLPVAQVGGHVVRARLLGRSQNDLVAAGASTIVDFTVGVLTQAVYTAAGIVLLLRVARASDSLNEALVVALALLVVGLIALYVLQRGRMLARTVSVFQKILAGNLRSMAGQLHARAQGLDSAVNQIYRRRGGVARSVAWRMLTWLLHTGETWLIMRSLGAPVSWSEAVILESLGTAVRNAAFPIPAGLGAQEGGFLLLGTALGISPPLCLALSLAKRARELIVGLPALGTWAWIEGRKKRP